MPITLDFIGVTPGDKCELYHGAPYSDRELRGKIDPLQTVAIDAAKRATFSADPGSGYAIRLLDKNGKVYARSNTRSLTAKRSLVVLPITVRTKEAEFGQNAPDLPFQTGDTTFDRLTLDFVGKDLRVFGHAFHDGVIDKRFTFDYRFRVLPVDVPVWTPLEQLPKDEVPQDTFELDTTSLKIDADKNRQEVLMGILNPIIRGQFRKAIQKKFHQSLVKQTAGNVLKPVMTVKKVVLEDNKHLDLEMGLLGEALG
ncbi:MAG: hypothetical protein JNK48_18180 [Bryobacterales bacterium]|nr:hypothetical protein [Bryobacterales bacterium]